MSKARTSWLRRLFTTAQPHRTPLVRLKLETLEDRAVPAILMVTVATDNGNNAPGELRTQIAAANAGDTINFANNLAGQTITLTKGKIALTLGTFTIDGTNLNVTISGGNNTGIFEINNQANVTINNPSLINANANTDGAAIAVGLNTVLNLTNDTFSGNTSNVFGGNGGHGGAIANLGALTVTNCTFNNNKAKLAGGAISSNGWGSQASASLTITGSTFQNNAANDPGTPPTGNGGAIFSADITSVQTSTFTSNTCDDTGGAINFKVQNIPVAPPFVPYVAALTVDQCTFTTNMVTAAAAFGGGAIDVDVSINAGSMSMTVTNSTFFSNTSAGNDAQDGGAVQCLIFTKAGAGVFEDPSAGTTFRNDTFFKNISASRGGAIALFLTNTGALGNTASLTSLTVNQNTAGTDGGGVYVLAPGANQTGAVSVNNSIFDGNFVSATGFRGSVDIAFDNIQALADIGYNLVGSSNNGFDAVQSNDIIDNTNNPGLANALADNNAQPGFPQTLAADASLGFENGDPTWGLSPDERGRIRMLHITIGAEDPDAVVPTGGGM